MYSLVANSVYTFISYLLHPYVFLLLLLGASLVYTWRKRPEQRRGLLWVVIPFLLLVALSTPAVAFLALGSLEWQYGPQDEWPKEAEALVVLDGGGLVPDRGRKRPELAPASLFRVLHAARLYHQAGSCLVLVTGGGSRDPEFDRLPFVDVMAKLLIQLGVRSSDVLVEHNSLSTYENAVESRKLLEQRGVNRIVLVTDAIHLPRAVRCFRKQGFEVTPSGCHYRATEFKLSFYQFLPSVGGIGASEDAAHEWVGLLSYWLSGRI